MRCSGRWRCRCLVRWRAVGVLLLRWRTRRRGGGRSAVARWRERAPLVIPEWVFDDTPEAMAWLDDLYERDFDLWYEALVTILSTPTCSRPVERG